MELYLAANPNAFWATYVETHNRKALRDSVKFCFHIKDFPTAPDYDFFDTQNAVAFRWLRAAFPSTDYLGIDQTASLQAR